jgi:hypothetical protein
VLKQLKKELCYDPNTGVWTWLISKGRKCKKGQRAGWIHHNGYRFIIWKGVQYSSARLAWFYMTGTWPIEVDHKNNKPSDDSWNNLREASRTQNMRNQKKQYRVSHKGIVFCRGKKQKPYRARIHIAGISKHLGYFATKTLAHTAYIIAAKKYFGEFARAS